MRRATAVLATLALVPLPALLMAAPAQATQAPTAFSSAPLPTWQVGGSGSNDSGIVWATAASGGLVFAGGTFTSIRPPGSALGSNEVARSNFAVFDAATGAPTGCAPTFTLPTDPASATVRSLNVSPDGRTLYVGGYFSTVNGVPAQHLAAIDLATCTLVSSFKPLPTGMVRAIASTASTVYYGGSFTAAGTGAQTRARAAAASAVGTATPGALLPWAPTFDGDVRALALKPDGSTIVVGGAFDNVNGTNSHALAAVAPDGSTAHAFTGFIESRSTVQALAADDSGFYTGDEGTGGGAFDGRVAVNWGYDQRWRDTCLGATQAVVPYQGLLYSGSHAHDCSTMGWWADGSRHHLLAESLTGDVIAPFFPDTNDGLGEALGPRAMVVASTSGGDYLWTGGEFTTVGGVAQQGLTRFGQGTDAAGPTVPAVTVTSPRTGQVRIAWRESTDTDDFTLTYRVYRDSETTPIYTVDADSSFWNRKQLSFTDTGVPGGSRHSYRVAASDGTTTVSSSARTITVSALGSLYAERVLADGPSWLWRYDDPSDVLASDATPNGYDGFVDGSATFGGTGALLADPSKAITLTGSNTSVYGDSAQTAPATYSVETWFNTTTTTGGKLIGFGNKQTLLSSSYDRHVYMANDGTLLFGVDAGNLVTIRSPKSYNDGAWHQVVATQDGSGIALYVDGARVAQANAVGTSSYRGYWHVGGDNLSSWTARPTSNYWNGSLDETAVYPAALSAGTIADHYLLSGRSLPAPPPALGDLYGQATNALSPSSYWRFDETSGSTASDASGNGQTADLGSAVQHGATGAVPGTAVALDGTTSSRISSTTSQIAPNEFSESAFFRTTTNNGGKIIGFGNAKTGNSGNYDRQVWMRSDGRLSFGIYTGQTVIITSSQSYNDGSYHHVVATRNASGMALYVDGQPVGTNSVTDLPQQYSGYVRVGGDNLNGWNSGTSTSEFAGSIDEVAVFTRALTAQEVAANDAAAHGSGGTDTTAPTAPAAVLPSASAGGLTLSWWPSSDGVGVAGYRVYRSGTPGFTPDAGSLVGTVTTTSYVDTVAPGVWYYRVVAFDAAGNSSAPSNQTVGLVGDTTAPTVPGQLAAQVVGSTVQLGWTPSTDDAAVLDYVVYRSATSGFTPASGNVIASSPTPSYVDTPPTGKPAYYRVAARDASGNVSPAAAEVSALIPDAGAPTTPASVTATVNGKSVTVTWSAATDDVGVTGYDVYRSASAGATPGTAIGSVTGTSFTEANVPEGTWYYRVVAKDGAGNRSAPSADATAVLSGQTVVMTVVPGADSYANAGAPGTNYGTSTTLISRGSPGSTSYLRFALPAVPAGKALTGAVLRLRTTTDAAASSTNTHDIGTAPDTWTESTLTWNNRPAVSGTVLGTVTAPTAISTSYDTPLDQAALTPLLGASTTLTVSSKGTDGLSFWSHEQPTASNRPQLVLTFSPVVVPPSDTTPPTTPGGLQATVTGSSVALSWTASTDDTAVTGYRVYRSATAGFTPGASTLVSTVTATGYSETQVPGTWYYAVDARDAAGNASAPTALVSAVVTTPPPPTLAAPTGVQTGVSGSTVTVSWAAVSGATGYDLHRSATTGFTPSVDTLVASPTTTSFQDTGRPVGTWYYRVIAHDGVGTVSPASGEVSAVVPPPTSDPTVLTAVPLADSYGNAAATGTNYGSSLTLASRGSTGYAAYLRFVLPAAPAGKTLVSAVLRLHTTSEATAGSTDSHSVSVAGDGWTEGGLTWANRPATTRLLGTITGATSVNTSYDTALTPASLSDLLGTQQSLAVTSTGSDSLYFFSHECTISTSRPQLILTFA